MPKIAYIEKKFKSDVIRLIKTCESICADFSRRGFELSLRQLYYQLVKENVISNDEKSYKHLGDIVSDARMAGIIDWNHIVDRTRNLRAAAAWDSASQAANACASQYRINRWQDQPIQVECWVEKDALANVVMQACDPYSVPYFSCRGYCSQSEMWAAGMRILRRAKSEKKNTLVLYLGDHDPSGIDMTRDVQDRLSLFTGAVRGEETEDGTPMRFIGSFYFQVRRIALSKQQIEKYDPPPNPAKVKDSRAKAYIDEHGEESWELDALSPEMMVKLISDHIQSGIYQDAWDTAMEREKEEKNKLRDLAARMDEQE